MIIEFKRSEFDRLDRLIGVIATIVADDSEWSRGVWKSNSPLRGENSCYKIKVVSRKREGDRSDGWTFGTGSRGTSVAEAFDRPASYGLGSIRRFDPLNTFTFRFVRDDSRSFDGCADG